MARSAAEMMIGETPAMEATEPKVEAVPKLRRSALGYLEPRQGLDGLQYFGQCSSCQSFVPEAAMGGAVRGSRCALFGADFPVTDDDCCDRWLGWASGIPCAAVVEFNAGEVRKGLRQAVAPWDVGYKSDETCQCKNCVFADRGDPMKPRPPGVAECEAFQDLNERAPNLFELDTAINLNGGCNLWTEPPDDDDYAMPAVPASIRGRT